MDSALISQLFKRLFIHRPCSACSRHSYSNRRSYSSIPTRRSQLHGRKQPQSSIESDWQQRNDNFPPDKADEFQRFPHVTSDLLRAKKERPRRSRMLMRDFIEDSLYNPNYGYFSKQVVIWTPGDPFDFSALPDESSFYTEYQRRYTDFEDVLDAKEYSDTRQLWHTPTELFRPYYGEAIARYLIANYKLQLYPYEDLLIYEMGAGNGTLMMNILDYIHQADPEVYARTRFRVIEVSTSLASIQQNQLLRSAEAKGHADKVSIVNKSIFDWDTYVSSPCYFLALEVFDNFAHDIIRYDPVTEEPLQASALIDAEGEFYEFYSKQLDPVAARYLRVRDAACAGKSYNHPLRQPRILRNLRNQLPLAPNLSQPEYIPTRLMHFFDVLRDYFPNHRLVTSDFHSLPDAVEGVNAPVVQTRYQRRMVPVRTPLVHQGFFDILFPTDFGVMEDTYRAVTGKLTRVMTHEDFFKRWAFVEDTQTRNGGNPLLSWYKNASVMITV
ncbi:S-adenosyl-L-methionine-dependent methyltransferase [Delphinella strobiligena]|nr:S-adenosyl-L-methionine-dependent methyltransferase [Delphinella strobiligena]